MKIVPGFKYRTFSNFTCFIFWHCPHVMDFMNNIGWEMWMSKILQFHASQKLNPKTVWQNYPFFLCDLIVYAVSFLQADAFIFLPWLPVWICSLDWNCIWLAWFHNLSWSTTQQQQQQHCSRSSTIQQQCSTIQHCSITAAAGPKLDPTPDSAPPGKFCTLDWTGRSCWTNIRLHSRWKGGNLFCFAIFFVCVAIFFVCVAIFLKFRLLNFQF